MPISSRAPSANRLPIVAIDGPAGAGKSTVARKVAEALGFVLVDTGAMYRAVALAASRKGIPFGDGAALGELARSIVEAEALTLDRGPSGAPRVLLSGEDVSEAIRTPPVAMAASLVSPHPEVRAALLDLQRRAGREGGVVLEGRDIGTVVFPDAEVKFFLTARPEVRARRRYEELVAKGKDVEFDATLDEVRQRDAADSSRPIAPLKQADGALLVDTSERTINETVDWMVAQVRAVMH